MAAAAHADVDATGFVLLVNGREHRMRPDPRTTVLDAPREQIGLTGTKKGCDHGQCGTCTVHIDGERTLSCLMLVAGMDVREIVKIERIGNPDGDLYPMQQAFTDHDAFQCGYCTPGQIMVAIACVLESHAGSAMEIQAFVIGNLYRCAAYPNIVTAVEQTGRMMETDGEAAQ